MHMKIRLLLILLFIAYGCWPPGLDPDRKPGKFLEDVVNLEDFNSEYDDYNSNLPVNRYGELHLIFSSKRERKDVFNLVYMPVQMLYDDGLRLSKDLDRGGLDYYASYGNAAQLIHRANGQFNVYGPRLISMFRDLNSFARTDTLLLFYADDADGNMEIKYLQNGTSLAPAKFELLNSPANDAYPTFSRAGDRIYFSSDRGGNFDIYELSIPRIEAERITVASLVNPIKYQLRKVEELSGPYNDKCPYLLNNTMVFVSDRPGGQGGEDIYYSNYENGKWSTPINAGERVNTPHNEYRPVLPSLSNFNYLLMIFSSNRPGGKGGYDLYMTGLKEP